jgi:hypothetical protein
MPNGSYVCAPTPTGGAGIGPALALVVVLYFVIKMLKKDDSGQEQPEKPQQPNQP